MIGHLFRRYNFTTAVQLLESQKIERTYIFFYLGWKKIWLLEC